MRVALKEWAVVIEALATGRQLFLLRKGGIAESRKGFELRHRRFLFFPTWEHQHAGFIRPAYRDSLTQLAPADPDALVIRYVAEATDILKAPASMADFGQLEPHHIWDPSHIEMRYRYRPDLPLYLVIVRTCRLPSVVVLRHEARYRGCRSWVDLSTDVSIDQAEPVTTEGAFGTQRGSLLSLLDQAFPEK